MTLILVGLLALAVAIGVWHFRGGTAAATLVVVMALTIVPSSVLTLGTPSAEHTTIASAGVALYTYHLALLFALVAISPRRVLWRIPIALGLLPFLLVLVALANGEITPHVLAGIAQWAFVALAWGVGAAIIDAVRRGELRERFLASVIALVVLVHLAGSVLQLLGIRSVETIVVGPLQLARVSGLAGHSGNLGKILLLLLIFYCRLRGLRTRALAESLCSLQQPPSA